MSHDAKTGYLAALAFISVPGSLVMAARTLPDTAGYWIAAVTVIAGLYFLGQQAAVAVVALRDRKDVPPSASEEAEALVAPGLPAGTHVNRTRAQVGRHVIEVN